MLTFYVYLIIILYIVKADNEPKGYYHPFLETSSKDINPNELDPKYWINIGQQNLKEKIKRKLNLNTAKNVIFFLGDGMGIQTVTAARPFIDDISYQLSFEKFPYFGLSKTYCVDKQVADSACSATAYLCGVKGNYKTIGVNANVVVNSCNDDSSKSNHVESIVKWAQNAKKSTGIVTTTRITHASPAGVYAHISNRDWECDSWIENESNCDTEKNQDIAQQLINSEVGKKLKVILGGGRSMFLDKSLRDEEGYKGLRKDGRNLINEWLKERNKNGKAKYVWNRKDLLAVDTSKIDYLLGLTSPDHCPYSGDIKRFGWEKAEPTLTEMMHVALKIVQKEKNGYFLFIEGGRIDHAHHDVKARKALEDTEEFAKAVELARNLTFEEDTLIIVTADHSHTLTVNGYPKRGSDILGLSGGSDDYKLPYTAISYANGRGHYKAFPKDSKTRRDITYDDFSDPNYEYPGTVPVDMETHGGEDVGIFASGPFAHLFDGNYEQSNIPMLMAYAAKIGPYADAK